MIAAMFAAMPGWAAQPRTKDQAIMDKPDWTASWIWAARDKYDGYNDTVEARKTFDLPEPGTATLRITADTVYRVYVNGEWANDGPGRAWPEHYQYDIIDVTPYVRAGKNEIRVIAKFFGIGTFHQIPQEAGLLAQLDVTPKAGGKAARVVSDGTWEMRTAAGWLKSVGKQSVQTGPFEDFDARNVPEGDTGFAPAVVRYAAAEGPWKNLEPRDCPLLTRKPFAFKALHGTAVVERSPWQTFVFPTASWIYGGVVWSNNNVVVSGAFATVAAMDKPGDIVFDTDDNTVVIDGKPAKNGKASLEAGKHFVLIVLSDYFGHWRHDTELRVKCSAPVTLRNPINDSADTPWCFAPFNETRFTAGDTEWKLMPETERNAITAKVDGMVKDHVQNSGTLDAFKQRLGGMAKIVGRDEWTESPHFLFESRKPLKDANAVVENADAVVKGEGAVMVQPNTNGDVELCYDLGEQNVGHWQFVIDGEAGLVVDLSGEEYITPAGRAQPTDR